MLFSRRRTGSNLVGKARLFGKDIELSERVKYLGVILYRKLNWIAHVTDIRPMLSHVCVVWWPRLDVERAKREISEVQRLVCLCATGAMKTTATAAIEVLLSVPPMDILVKAKAFITADRLAQCDLWTSDFQNGHCRIRNVISNHIFEMPRDRITPRLEFERNFDAIFPSRQEWMRGWPTCLPIGGCIRFTDGSKTNEGTGAGVYVPEEEDGTWYHLGNHPSVFQAETFAALMGACESLPEEAQGKKVFICSDSESAIKALVSPVITSKLVKECKDYLNQRGLANQVTLVRVPGHSNVEDNERADESASVDGAEPYVPIPQSLCMKAVNDWVKAEHAKRWLAYEGGVHTKHFLSKPLGRWSRELRKMDRNRIRRVVGAITGHCGLNKHLTKMTIRSDSDCSCGTDEETGLHVICECPKFHHLRLRTFGSYVLRPSDVVKLGPVVLDRFLAATLRLS